MMDRQQMLEEFDGDAGEYLAVQSKSFQKLAAKNEKIIMSLIELYGSFVRKGTAMKSPGSFAKQEQIFNESDQREFFNVPDSLLEGINGLMNAVFTVTADALKQLNSRDDSLSGAYDEVLLRLEKELRQSIKNEEKLKIQIECMQVKAESLRKQVLRAEEQADKLRLEVAAIKKDNMMKTRQKETEIIQLKKEKEIAKSMQRKLEASRSVIERPHTTAALEEQQQPQSNQYQQQSSEHMKINNEGSILWGRTQGTISLDPDRFNLIRKSVNRIVPDEAGNMEKKRLAHQVMQANKQKEMEGQKYSYEINRLKIQNEQKDLENKKIKRSLDELHAQLKLLKDEITSEKMKKWANEVSSERNPNLVSFYKDKIDGKDAEIRGLKKAQKKFAVMEKKLLVKEKAFEYERADYHEKLLYLDERVKKISKLYSDSQTILKHPKFGAYNAHFLQDQQVD